MTDNNNKTKPTESRALRLRWSWFPSLLFGDGILPSVLILTLVMLRRYGLNNAQVTFYISLLSIPFALRPLLEMTVDYFRGTTKVWILSAEFISALSLWAIAFTLPTGYWLQATMWLMPFAVVSGVVYDIATSRFYVDDAPMASPKHELLSRLFRCTAMLFGIGAVAMLAGNMEVVTRNVRYSWSSVFYIMAGAEFFLWLWHSIFLPGSHSPYIKHKDTFGLNRHEYNIVVDAATRGFHNRFMLYFFALFMLPESLMCLVTPLFFIDMPHNGGLGLAPQEFGLTFGTMGIIAIFIGSHIGNIAIRRYGMRRWMLPMAAVMSLHGLAMLYLSYNLSVSLAFVCLATFAGNLVLGFGSSAYQSAIASFACRAAGGVFRQAIAMSLMSLTTILTGIFSGLLQINIGYRQFFIIATGLYAITFVVAAVFTLVRKISQ